MEHTCPDCSMELPEWACKMHLQAPALLEALERMQAAFGQLGITDISDHVPDSHILEFVDASTQARAVIEAAK